MTRKAKEKERILLFNNFQRADEVRRRVANVCGIANATVIPICKALKMPILKPSVLQWVADEEAFREAFVAKVKREVAEYGGYVSNLVRDVTADEEKLVTIKGDEMAVDETKLEEYTNVYLTDPARIEAYHKCEQLCEYLNGFFAGNIPANDAFNSWASYVYPTPEGFKVNGRADFGRLITNK